MAKVDRIVFLYNQKDWIIFGRVSP